MTRKRQRSAASVDGVSPRSNARRPSTLVDELEMEENGQEVAEGTNWFELVDDGRSGNSNAQRAMAATWLSETKTKAVSPGTVDEVVVERVVPPTRRAVVWFRRNLRVHDNLALDAAIRAQQQMLKNGEGEMDLLPIYIVHRPVKQRCGPLRFQFLLEVVQDLANSIDKLQGRLLVLRGDAEEVIRAVLPAWGITDIFFEAGVMPYAVARDERVRAIATALNVRVVTTRGVTLYDPHEIIRLNGGEPPMDYDRICEITDNMLQPAQPIPAPVQLRNAARFTTEQLFVMLNKFCLV